MRRKRILFLVVAATVVSVLGAGSLAVHQRTSSIDRAQHGYDVALSEYRSAEGRASSSLSSSERTIASARETLESSAGRVAGDKPRAALATAITRAQAHVDAKTRSLAEAAEAAASVPQPDGSLFQPGEGLVDATSAVKTALSAAKTDDPAVADSLAAAEQAVQDAMAAWQSTLYTNHVQAVGWVPELDQCLGSVDITAHYAGVAAIAEHWSCGGKDFPDDAGTVITLTGVHSGVYRVEGIVAMLSSSRNGVGDLPRGHDLLYQTCQNGQSSSMSFTALTKIG